MTREKSVHMPSTPTAALHVDTEPAATEGWPLGGLCDVVQFLRMDLAWFSTISSLGVQRSTLHSNNHVCNH